MPRCVRRRRVAVFLTAASLAVAPAFAASLAPVTSAELFAHSYSGGSGVAITDTFDDPPGTSLATTTDTCGDPWTVVGGTFAVSATEVVISSTSGLVTGTVPLCGSASVNEEVGGDIHSSGSSLFGLLLNAETGGRPATAAVYNNAGAGTVSLKRLDAAGVATTWAASTHAGGGNAPIFLRMVYLDGVYTVYVNGTLVLSYTTTTVQRTAVEAHNAIGIVAFTDTKSSFDNLQSYPR